jgi:hypothetical protein
MNKKQLFLLLISFLGCLNSFAQSDLVLYNQNWEKKTVYWGYYVGLNQNTQRISYRKTDDTFVDVQPSTSFNLGMIGGLRLHEYVSLRFEPGFTNSNVRLTFRNLQNSNDSLRVARANYFRLPLLVKVNSKKYRNMRSYVIGGVSYDRNFSGNENDDDDNESGSFRMKENNFSYEIGLGMDFYLPYFIFSPSIRGIFAINNELVYDNNPDSEFTRNIDYMGVRGVFLKFAFH